jgi:hypothetical protein
MISKASQLFLELYLLRIRYSDSEINEASNFLRNMNDPELDNLLSVLKQIDAAPSGSKTSRRPKPSGSYLGTSSAQSIQKAIVHFVERLGKKRLLQTPDELENFAQSIGVKTYQNDRATIVRAIREALESMSPNHALQSMRSVDSQSKSDSDAYVSLAKTLMRR